MPTQGDLTQQFEPRRAPRVRITYDLEMGGGIETRELPFVLGVLADLSIQPESPIPALKDRRFVTIDRDNFERVMERTGSRITFHAENALTPNGEKILIDLRFSRLADFEPQNVVHQVKPLRDLLELRRKLTNLSSSLGGTPLAGMLQEAIGNPELEIETIINPRVSKLDDLLSLQLNEIIHAPLFQKAEATWRGMYHLVNSTETSSALQIRVLNVSKKDLTRDFGMLGEFRQSKLFRKVYEDNYGTLGGEPFGALVGDYEFGPHPEDIKLLELVSNVAAAAHAPFIAAASPALFRLKSFVELGAASDLTALFEGEQWAMWRSFRETEDSRFIGLVLPHMLLRLPYGMETTPVKEFHYEEGASSKTPSAFLWGNSSYAFAVQLMNAFAHHGWCAAISGVEAGGLVEGLPSYVFSTDNTDIALKCPSEIAITDTCESELAGLGFITLCYLKSPSCAAFLTAPSCNKSMQSIPPEGTGAGAAHQLNYVMVGSRFAHYLKVIIRDKIGAVKTRDEWEALLNGWISQYVLTEGITSEELKAQRPLRYARIEILEMSSVRVEVEIVAYLQPHFQFSDAEVMLRVRRQDSNLRLAPGGIAHGSQPSTP